MGGKGSGRKPWDGNERRGRDRRKPTPVPVPGSIRQVAHPPKANMPAQPPGIVLRKLAYGPDGFTCRCGGQDFDRNKETIVAGSNRFIRHAYSCTKCKESYVFVPPFALPGGTIF